MLKQEIEVYQPQQLIARTWRPGSGESRLRVDNPSNGTPVVDAAAASSKDVQEAPVMAVESFEAGLEAAIRSEYGLAATVLTASMASATKAWRELPVGTVKINNVFGGAPGGAAHPRRGSGQGYGYGPELLDEFTATKAVHWASPKLP